jgi:hypothetical protein
MFFGVIDSMKSLLSADLTTFFLSEMIVFLGLLSHWEGCFINRACFFKAKNIFLFTFSSFMRIYTSLGRVLYLSRFRSLSYE